MTNVGIPVSVGVDLFSANRSIYWIDSNDDKVIKRSSDLSQSMVCIVVTSTFKVIERLKITSSEIEYFVIRIIFALSIITLDNYF